MDMPAITEALRAEVGDNSGLDAILEFDCGADGLAVTDGKSVPDTVGKKDREADCTVSTTKDKLVALIEGELSPTNGFMMGKFKFTGDMSVAMKLQRVV